VLDDAGNVRSAQREDGASMFRFDVALGKAWASVAMGVSSRALLKRAKDNPNFFITLAATAKGKFLPQTGGVLIKNEKGEILGAAGASGGTGEEDEAACVHGIEQAGFAPDAAGCAPGLPIRERAVQPGGRPLVGTSIGVMFGSRSGGSCLLKYR